MPSFLLAVAELAREAASSVVAAALRVSGWGERRRPPPPEPCPFLIAGLPTAQHQFFPPLPGRTVAMGAPIEERKERRRRRRETDPEASDSEDEKELGERLRREADERRRLEQAAMRGPPRKYASILEIDGQPVLRHWGVPPEKPQGAWGFKAQERLPPRPVPPTPPPTPVPVEDKEPLGRFPRRLPGPTLEYPFEKGKWESMGLTRPLSDQVFLFPAREETKARELERAAEPTPTERFVELASRRRDESRGMPRLDGDTVMMLHETNMRLGARCPLLPTLPPLEPPPLPSPDRQEPSAQSSHDGSFGSFHVVVDPAFEDGEPELELPYLTWSGSSGWSTAP